MEAVEDEYRKMSMEHTMKLSKDVIETINKKGKNNAKFYELQDEELQQIINLLYELNYTEYRADPYSLLESACVHTGNLQKTVSALIALLYLASDRIELEEQ